jgi:hypothetical protein
VNRFEQDNFDAGMSVLLEAAKNDSHSENARAHFRTVMRRLMIIRNAADPARAQAEMAASLDAEDRARRRRYP